MCSWEAVCWTEVKATFLTINQVSQTSGHMTGRTYIAANGCIEHFATFPSCATWCLALRLARHNSALGVQVPLHADIGILPWWDGDGLIA